MGAEEEATAENRSFLPHLHSLRYDVGLRNFSCSLVLPIFGSLPDFDNLCRQPLRSLYDPITLR